MSNDALITVLAGLDAHSILSMFWFLILFEGPRFVLANIAAAIAILRREAPRSVSRDTAVSVIVPCHNGAANLGKTVASIREQTLRNVQTVVVSDGSIDETVVVAKGLCDENAIDFVASADLRGGKSAALNLALQYCKNPIIICVDCDTTFGSQSFSRLAAAFDEPTVGAAGGNIGIRNPDASLLATMQAVEYTVSISLGRRIGMMLGILPIASGAFSAFRRDALVATGGWEAGPGEDADLTMKLRQAGWDIAFVPEACALTDAPIRLDDLWSQRVRWESDLVRLHIQKFRTCLSPRPHTFSIRNALGAIDALMFSFGMSFVLIAYLTWLIAIYGLDALSILFVGVIVYSVVGFLYFIVSASLGATQRPDRLLPYAFGYGLYSLCILQPIRICACIGELLFQRSMRPGFVPSKVLNQIGSV